jgi:DNA-binding HxlR family transcriptional regulator
MKRQETGNFRERFGALRRLVEAVSDTMLIQELKEMVADGIAVRRDYHEIRPRPEYRFGMSLAEASATGQPAHGANRSRN